MISLIVMGYDNDDDIFFMIMIEDGWYDLILVIY